MDLITTTPALADACARLAAQAFVTVDTEFMRETTYYPKLCLIQMAGPDGTAVLVDPLVAGDRPEALRRPDGRRGRGEGLPLGTAGPRDHLAARRAAAAPVLRHAGRRHGLRLRRLVSYEQLVNDVAKAKIDKSSRFTDWSRRPLSDAQLAYALSDVTHLVRSTRCWPATSSGPTGRGGSTRRWAC